MIKKSRLAILKSSSIPNQFKNLLILQNPIQNLSSASDTALYSLASFITYKFPIFDPRIQTEKIHDFKQESNFNAQHLSYHPLIQIWTAQFVQSMINQNAISFNNTLYLLITLSQSKFQQIRVLNQKMNVFNQTQLSILANKKFDQLKQIFQLQNVQQNKKRIAVLNVSASQLKSDKYAPIINVSALLLGSIFNNQKWFIFNILKGEIPTIGELSHLDAVFIPGSSKSVLNQIKQIDQLMQNIMNVIKVSNRLKVVGICYGHQLIAIKHKAKVIKKNRYGGLQKIEFDEDLIKKYQFLEPLKDIVKNGFFAEHHQDYVQQTPQGFELLGWSKSCKVQAMVQKNRRFLSFQFHPQYIVQFTKAFEKRLINYYKINEMDKFYVQTSNEMLTSHHLASEKIRKCISLYINQ